MAEIVTTDPYDLLVCYRSLEGKWQELRQNWRLEPGDWTVDYTEGTKPMVAALMLVTLNDSSGYRYAGGTKALSQINPWDELAGVHRHEAAILFWPRTIWSVGRDIQAPGTEGERRREAYLQGPNRDSRGLQALG